MKTPDQLLKELSLELDRLNPYEEGNDGSYAFWKEGAQFILSKAQDNFRKNEPSDAEKIEGEAYDEPD